MARHVFMIIINDPPAEEIEAFEKWYVGRHMPDVLAVPGFVAAQRFRLAAEPNAPARHMTLYEIETDDRDAVMAEVRSRVGTERMPQFEGSERGPSTIFFGEAVTPRTMPTPEAG
jgi:hypothetical protein